MQSGDQKPLSGRMRIGRGGLLDPGPGASRGSHGARGVAAKVVAPLGCVPRKGWIVCRFRLSRRLCCRLVLEECHHRAGPGQQNANRIVGRDEQYRPEQARACGRASHGQHQGHRDVRRGAEDAGAAGQPNGRRRHGQWKSWSGGFSRWRGICARAGNSRSTVLLFEAAYDLVWIQPHDRRIGPDERAAINPLRPPGEVVVLEAIEQRRGNLRLVGNRLDGNSAALALFAQPCA